MVGGSFHVVFTDDHYGTSMPGAGAVHLIKGGKATLTLNP
jgi:hypothetical protein